MGDGRTRLILWFRLFPSSRLDGPNYGLAAFVDVDMLDANLLRCSASVSLQSLELSGESPLQLC